jgi:hypothetical protein
MLAYDSTVSRIEALTMLQNYFVAVESFLLEGYRVVTPAANYGTSIRGNFDSKTDSFDPNRHRVEAIVSPGAHLRRAIRERAYAQKKPASQMWPEPLEYIDWNSGWRNNLLTPRGMGQLVGQHLKFDPTQPDQGIFFVAADGSTTQVEVVSKNTGTELMFLIPVNLTPGEYTLEVRSNLGQSPLRTGRLEASLIVH